MRLDLFLKQSRIIPRRSLAHEACEQGAILVNGQLAKGSKLVRAGDLILWRYRNKRTQLRVVKIPMVQPGKKEASALYQLAGIEILSH